MAGWFPIWLHKDEAAKLREILTQTATQHSIQSGLITRIDAALEEAQRSRYGRNPTSSPEVSQCPPQ